MTYHTIVHCRLHQTCSNAVTTLKRFHLSQMATGGFYQWQGMVFDYGGGGGWGSGSSSPWLLEAAVDDGAQHWWGVQWRISRATSGCKGIYQCKTALPY